MAFTVSLSQPAIAGQVTPPSVPPEINVPDGNVPFLVGHAVGTQNYFCKPSATSSTGVAYALFTPEATLFNDDDGQIITHFFSPNPDPRDPNSNPAVVADGAIRATWQHSHDSSEVWAKVHQVPGEPIGSVIVDRSAVAWLRLDAVGVRDGPTGGGTLSKTTFVQRVNTVGGNPPTKLVDGVVVSVGCSLSTDVGNQAFVPYTADYFFYFNPKANQ